MNNSKETWKGIKSFIVMKNIISAEPRTLSHGENAITSPCEIALHCNYFSSAANTAKQYINYSHKRFSEQLKHQCNNSYLSNLQTVRKQPTSYLLSTSIKLVVLSVFQIKS